MVGQFRGHSHQVEGIHCHPGGSVRLLEVYTIGQRDVAVEDADVVQPEEAALEDVPLTRVFAVRPPCVVQQQLVEDAFEEDQVSIAATLPPVDLEDAPGGPCVNRRIDIAERPLVRRELPVWVHVPLAREQRELVLCELRVDQSERHAVKRQVPGGVPRVFPFVGHGDHVGVVQVQPFAVTAVLSLRRRRGLGRVTDQPARHFVTVELLAPDHSRERLPSNRASVFIVEITL